MKEKGYNVVVVQNPTKSLPDDVAFTKSAIDSLKSEVVLVGHSYGGVVITEAGTHPQVTDSFTSRRLLLTKENPSRH